ncbi:CMRF35-like molecule 8 isoform X2 [Pimephales promelas]|uniref:CMRF35-like molecule 8 isoform X2 n=1 Tax=Pimephales promelas TaxID=90988 RepID=UPI001955AD41|nr:CMRF35-like molecule 8 isoform X2 [Pimephales promelas]
MLKSTVMRTVSSISFSVFVLSALCLMNNSLALTVTGSVGSNISVSCRYPETYENSSKFFCQMSGRFQCVHTSRRDARSERGRLALLDDTSAHVLTALVSSLAPEDSGRYWCGVDIDLLPDFTSEIWITVSKGDPQEQTIDLFPEERDESYSRFMMMVALMCVCALLFVILFGLFQVLKHSSRRNSGSAPHRRTISNPVQDAYQRIRLPDSSKAQSGQEEFYRPINLDYINTEAVDTDSYYIDVVPAQTQDHIYTELNASRRSHVYQSFTADSAQEEAIYNTIDH